MESINIIVISSEKQGITEMTEHYDCTAEEIRLLRSELSFGIRAKLLEYQNRLIEKRTNEQKEG